MKKINKYVRNVVIMDRTKIPIDDIIEIDGELFNSVIMVP